MSLSKQFFLAIWLPMFITGIGCTGNKARFDNMDSAVENNPAYRTLNDSIGQFPKDPLLYLRRANRLSQENAHELAYGDYLKAWKIKRGLDVGLPFAANMEILGKHQERRSLLDTLSRDFPGNSQIGRLLAESYAGSGDPGQALTLYNNML